MEKKSNLIEKLQEIQEKEEKRRDVAVKYLEELVELLTPIFYKIEGMSNDIEEEDCVGWVSIWNKEDNKYSVKNSNLYFRYNIYNEMNGSEYPGFYVSNEYKLWGKNLLEVQGSAFWVQIKRITDWITNYLPEYFEKKDISRDKRLIEFEQIVKRLKEN